MCCVVFALMSFRLPLSPDSSQSSLHSITAELRAELATQLDRERELREHLEKQLNDEQKIRCKSGQSPCLRINHHNSVEAAFLLLDKLIS